MMSSTLVFFVAFLLWNDLAHGEDRTIHSLSAQNWEDVFLGIPSPARAYEYLQVYTSAPHIAGSPEDYEMAQYTLSKFQEFGLNDSHIEAVPVLLTSPLNRKLEMIEPIQYEATLQEEVYPIDPSSGDKRVVPTFNGYSPSGNVTAPLIYVNYASIEDFQELENMGVNVTGAIGIARYGNLFRGTKAMIAQQKGMIGLILYSDPADDGYKRGTVFPEGPWKPKTGVQRGSVQFLSICPGDPTRKICSKDPNYNYTDGIPSIPVQPISWGDALPLLKNLGGPEAPASFQGGLNFTYTVGPGSSLVHLELDIKFEVKPIWNVIAKITGTTEADRVVILGNHRDAWTFGATDPNSGTASLLEVARAFGVMQSQGWKPRRSIILASWDGEEYGLLGSTAWAEANGDMLMKQAVAYLNVDVAVTGSSFGAAATHSLDTLLRNVTKQVTDPKTGKPLSEVWDGSIGDLGSGSDYTALLDHFGVASMDFGFDGPYGVYHSTYDDMYWMNHFGDPTFSYHKACAQVWGLAALKLADSSIVPLNYTTYSAQLYSYENNVEQLLNKYNITLNLSQLVKALGVFKAAANAVNREIAVHQSSDDSLNDRLVFTERAFLGGGIPLRPYYRHVIQAPGLYAGYAAQTFPGLTQSIEMEDKTAAQQQLSILVQSIEQAAAFLSGN